MKKIMTLAVTLALCTVPVCSYASDSWTKVRGSTSTVISVYSRAEFCWHLYATDATTGDIYRQTGDPKSTQWVKVGSPGKEFVSDGLHLYGLATNGSAVFQYTGVPMQWDQIGGAADHIYAGGGKLFATNPSTGDIYEYDGTWTKVGTAGKMFAVDDEGNLYAMSVSGDSVWRYAGAPMQWEKIGGSAGQIYAGGNRLYATNPDTGNIYEYSGQSIVWTHVGGAGKMFAVDDEGNLFGLSPDSSGVRRYTGTPMQWEQVGGPAAKIFAGGRSHVYATNPGTGELWHLVSSRTAPVSSYASDAWTKVRGPSSTVVAAYSRSQFCWDLYATEALTGDIYHQAGGPESTQWVKVGGPGKEFVSDGLHLYGLATNGSAVFQYTGVPMQWDEIGGAADHIYAGGGKLFATNQDTGDIYEYNGAWTKVGAPGTMFAVSDEGTLYGLSSAGSVWRYTGIPLQWEQIGGATAHIYAGGSKLFATNPDTGDIYAYGGQAFVWTKVGGQGAMFAVDDEGHLYGLSPGGSSVQRYTGTPMQWTQIGGPSAKIYAGGNRHVYATDTNNLWHHSSNPFAGPYYSVSPVTGRRRVLVILWDPHRAGHPAPSRNAIDNLICGSKPSVSDYFWENSGGRFSMECVGVLGWFNANKPASHYWGPKDQEDLPEDRNNNGLLDPGEDLNSNGVLDGPDGIMQPDEDTNGNGKLDYDLDGNGWISGHVEKWAEAIGKADPVFDFKAYDINHDGVLSPSELGIQIVIPQNDTFGTNRYAAGREQPWEPLVVDGVRIEWISEAYIGSPPSAGLVAHELAHLLLGAGDMYVYYFQPYMAGPYSLMDDSPSNPPHLDPFHKLKVGWLLPRIVTSSGWYRIRNIETSSDALILYDPDRGQKEYYIIENRWRGNSFDQYLPDSGLAVWHIIEDPEVFDALPAPPNASVQQWNAPEYQGWGRRAIRMIRPIYGPPLNWSLWDGSDPSTGYDLLPLDPNPNHVTLKWVDGTPSAFSVHYFPGASPEMEVYIEVQ